MRISDFVLFKGSEGTICGLTKVGIVINDDYYRDYCFQVFSISSHLWDSEKSFLPDTFTDRIIKFESV